MKSPLNHLFKSFSALQVATSYHSGSLAPNSRFSALPLSSSTVHFHSCLRRYGTSTDTESSVTDRMGIEAITETKRLASFYKEDNVKRHKPTVWTTPDEAAAFVRDEIDTVLFDCDGVLYRTLDQCPGAAKCIKGFLDQNKTVLFVTNNAGVNRKQLREKLANVLQIDELKYEQMISSSYAAAQYLKHQLGDISNARVHVIGSSGLCDELASNGFHLSGGPMESAPSGMTRAELAQYEFSEHPVDAVVVGHDTEMNFRKLCIAENLLMRNQDALFVATNKDSFDLVGADGRHIAGNGCTVVALEYATKRMAVNVGKPSPALVALIKTDHPGCMENPSRCLFVGDRLDTDIRFGKDNGMKTLLVMTGVTTSKMMEMLGEGTEEEPLPDFIVPFVGLLI
ncbi:4-nitrophenylphosphatase [Nitzschia inconspicua]|uniref:4-nitrophenylphosphatase n=1 Tax=Nitzschia inconspicua TaxID=303405 RepID=A0A9K3PJI4_9STRA|nr:4-nitrophenylphosphatase [Nitzschia inconspicua]KAG7364136.1 4-nitrophenylphosphatase [Nitzschia inconspicua]